MASKIPDNVANPEIYKKAKAKAKAKFEVYPSAYANGFMVQEYQRMGGEYKGAKKSTGGEVKAKKMNTGGSVEMQPRGCGAMMQNKRRTVRVPRG